METGKTRKQLEDINTELLRALCIAKTTIDTLEMTRGKASKDIKDRINNAIKKATQ